MIVDHVYNHSNLSMELYEIANEFNLGNATHFVRFFFLFFCIIIMEKLVFFSIKCHNPICILYGFLFHLEHFHVLPSWYMYEKC